MKRVAQLLNEQLIMVETRFRKAQKVTSPCSLQPQPDPGRTVRDELDEVLYDKSSSDHRGELLTLAAH